MNTKTIIEKINDLIDSMVIDGNEVNLDYMNSINNELGNPLDGQIVDAHSGRILLKMYINNLLDQAKNRIQ